MSTPNNDEVEGKFDQAKGWVKDKVGEATGDGNLEAEGEAENAKGHAQESWGKVKRGVGDAVKGVGDAISNAGKDVDKA
ncbi:MAG: CsbD family protein [Acidobacteriota bacterium]|nr:CsbD family protein [Acidobacteriota bacterium]